MTTDPKAIVFEIYNSGRGPDDDRFRIRVVNGHNDIKFTMSPSKHFDTEQAARDYIDEFVDAIKNREVTVEYIG